MTLQSGRGVELPLAEVVTLDSWVEWRDMEKDIMHEELAMKKSGWSETNWRRWLQLLAHE